MTWRTGLLGVAALLSACNAVTGADNITFSDDDDGSGASTGSGITGSGGSGGSTTGPEPQLSPADGVTVTAVTLYQGIRRPLMEGGAPSNSTIPVVTGREALLRIHYTADPSAVGKSVTARMSLGAERVEGPGTLVAQSTEADLSSTINLSIPGELVAPVGYRVELLEPTGSTSGQNAGAGYPPSGEEMLPAQSAGNQLKLVLVPIRYGGDGSNRLPDTSQSQIDNYRSAFYQIYPIPDVTITVLSPLQWNQTVSPLGSGWNSLLDSLINFRQQNGASADEYYYGIFNGAPTFGQWCGQGCVTGLSLLAGPNEPFARVGIGVGYTGGESADTAAHEIGHQHGRGHAPCGAFDGFDPAFPHSDGSIGEWGYDLLGGDLVPPSTPDFMSYCDPPWVSDHNFRQLFDRLRFVNNASASVAPPQALQNYERVIIDAEGEAHWGVPLSLTLPPAGQPTTVTLSSTQQVTGYFYPYSHLPGGMLLIPPSSSATLSFHALGKFHVVER